jgi:hypothetical protein
MIHNEFGFPGDSRGSSAPQGSQSRDDAQLRLSMRSAIRASPSARVIRNARDP